MKTKTLLLLCLFIGIGFARISAQKGQNGTGVVNVTMPSEYWLPIYLEGVKVGDIGGTVKWHAEFFYKDGNLIRVISHIKDILVENFDTGETFKANEQTKSDYSNFDVIDLSGYVSGTDHFNLIGNRGTHYIGYFTIIATAENPLGVYTIEKVIYPQGPK